MALLILPSPLPGSLSRVARRAEVGSGYPPLPLHGAACWLLVLFMSLVHFMADISVCNERATNNMKKRASVHRHIYLRAGKC